MFFQNLPEITYFICLILLKNILLEKKKEDNEQQIKDLLEIKNFGSKSADEVIEALERIGISIPQSRTSV